MPSPKAFLLLCLRFSVTLFTSSHASARELAYSSAAKAKEGNEGVSTQQYGYGGYGGGPGGYDNGGYGGGGYDRGGYGGDYGRGGYGNGDDYGRGGTGGYGRRYPPLQDNKEVVNPQQYDDGGYGGDGGYNRGGYGGDYGHGGYGGVMTVVTMDEVDIGALIHQKKKRIRKL